MKIFMTQLNGYLKKLAEEEDIAIEDGARLLSQAIMGAGRILIHGFDEMEAVVLEAIKGKETLPKVERLMENGQVRTDIDHTDRVLLITRFSNDERAIALAEQLQTLGVATVGISAAINGEEQSLVDAVDIHIDSKLTKPLIPKDDGTRFGFPAVMTALFAYYCLFFTIIEILDEYNQ
ncbi:DUF2529 domain-containing protein [Anoxybacteroides tepidamans]|uniref:DUF2529 domain-containing protein n=1 Tax=Anoxybacteroides tepidamans TaxID=265948 RepID=UPI000487A903|nr:DUF2529 domain-containing protein [Anoxybacillus tepidamans]